jgi:pyruvate, orthophosphate dikinase
MVMPAPGVDHAAGMAHDAGPLIFPFDHPHDVEPRHLVQLLGGKGAHLAEMTSVLGIDVPPGFTIGLPVCRAFRETGWPAGLDDALGEHVDRLGALMGRHFGDPENPLLVAVRSGSPVSMPGMLDTVLNLGLNEATVEGLARTSGDVLFAWDSYRRFVTMFATTVMEVPDAEIHLESPAESLSAMRDHVGALLTRIEAAAGRAVPRDPWAQLREAVEAVFRSWESERACAYRAREGIDENLGTAVNVQSMVFGNRGPRSGTGVVFTRNPSTGEAQPFGDYLPLAQGEDVVSGSAHPMPISHLGEHEPAAYAQLVTTLRRLEIHYRDMCDVEFTVEDGRLFLLQTRIGKRSATAAVRVAVELEADPDVRLTRQEAVARVPVAVRARARQEWLAQHHVGTELDSLLATALGASPGRASGRAVFSSDAALDADDDVILVRKETSPEDVRGMAASVGILTTKGGLVSHASVVARGWGIPAVVGAHDLTITGNEFRTANGRLIREGDVITIDGASGAVWLGRPTFDDQPEADDFPQLTKLEWWAAEGTP